MKDLVCIRCPRGCALHIDDNGGVTGNYCPKGKDYALSELTDPKRMVSTLVRVSNRKDTMLSVRTSEPISKDLVFDVIECLKDIKVRAPIEIGTLILTNIFETGVDIIATKSIK